MKNILISGGTGFLGRELIAYLHRHKFENITVLARNEGKLIELKELYPNINIIPGDVADAYICRKAVTDIDTIFHLSAFKHVGMAETETYQCVSSNIDGTINLLNEFHGDLFVAISTDKAAKISGVYGASKYIMEKLIEEYSKYNRTIRYVVPRYGNVLGSTGSILPKWIEAAKNHKAIKITEPKCTRFFFTVDDAVDLIFEAIEKGDNGKPYISHMKACYIGTLATAIEKKYGKYEHIELIGLQEGENLNEYLDKDYCSRDADKFTTDDLMEMI